MTDSNYLEIIYEPVISVLPNIVLFIVSNNLYIIALFLRMLFNTILMNPRDCSNTTNQILDTSEDIDNWYV